jgi:hypothetical protein
VSQSCPALVSQLLDSVTGSAAGPGWDFDLDMENMKRSEGMSHALEGQDTWVVVEVRSS